MALLNYTTKIDADKTAGEISSILRGIGASAVLTEYDKDLGIVSAISFKIELNGQPISFRLPTDWRPVQEVLERQNRKARNHIPHDQAAAVRVAWRIVKDWVEAQCAIIETRMVSTVDVFLPYAIMPNNQTLAEKIHESPQFLLGKGD